MMFRIVDERFWILFSCLFCMNILYAKIRAFVHNVYIIYNIYMHFSSLTSFHAT